VDIHLESGQPEDLGQAAAVPEGIEVVGDARRDAESLPEVAPALSDRPDERLRPRQVDVGLDEPTARYRPAARADMTPDRFEERRVEPFGPLVQDGLVVAEDEARMLVEDVDRVAEGRQALRRALLPPLPDRVEMGIADQVDRQIWGHNTNFRIILILVHLIEPH
jgi:hypothetical protein